MASIKSTDYTIKAGITATSEHAIDRLQKLPPMAKLPPSGSPVRSLLRELRGGQDFEQRIFDAIRPDLPHAETVLRSDRFVGQLDQLVETARRQVEQEPNEKKREVLENSLNMLTITQDNSRALRMQCYGVLKA